MSEEGGGLVGLPNFAVVADGMAGETAANIMYRGLSGQYRSEDLAVLIAQRQASIGQKPKLDKLQTKIDDLEMNHMTTANEAKRKELEAQINNLKAQKTQVEKQAKKALTKDRYLREWNLEASRINQVNIVRSWSLGAVGRPDQKDLLDRIIATRDKESAFRARQFLGDSAGNDGGLTTSSFVTQSYSGGMHGQN